MLSQWKKRTSEKVAWQDRGVRASAAVGAVLLLLSLNINCCLMLSGVTGTALSTKLNVD